jgi:hypothetical protein
VQNEIQEMATQLANETRLIGDATTKALLKEMWLIPGNRKRALISILLMVWQQMTGVNAIVRPLSLLPAPSLSEIPFSISNPHTRH